MPLRTCACGSRVAYPVPLSSCWYWYTIQTSASDLVEKSWSLVNALMERSKGKLPASALPRGREGGRIWQHLHQALEHLDVVTRVAWNGHYPSVFISVASVLIRHRVHNKEIKRREQSWTVQSLRMHRKAWGLTFKHMPRCCYVLTDLRRTLLRGLVCFCTNLDNQMQDMQSQLTYQATFLSRARMHLNLWVKDWTVMPLVYCVIPRQQTLLWIDTQRAPTK